MKTEKIFFMDIMTNIKTKKDQKSFMNILLLDGGLQGLSCGASLYKYHKVSIVSDELACRCSKFFTKVYTDVKVDKSLYELLEREQFDVLIPVSDMSVPFVSKNKDYIEAQYGVKCAVPAYEQVYQVEDKGRFMTFCKENNLPHPKTELLTYQSIEQAATKVGFPALIKPDFSVGARGITRVDSLKELKITFPLINKNFGNCTLQELIENKEFYYNVMLYRDKQGRFLGHTILKIVRMYPVAAGSSSYGITVKNETLLDICKECLNKLKWVGMADFDVLQRLDNGEYKIIEINPRVPASLRAAAISGVNFPEIVVHDALGFPIPQYQYNPGKALRYLGLDIMWFLKSSNRFKHLFEWLDFIRKDQYYQDIYACDPSTWWTWLAEGVGKIGNRNKKLR